MINRRTPNELVAGLADLECHYFRVAALVAMPEIKAERQLVGAKRSLAFIDRA